QLLAEIGHAPATLLAVLTRCVAATLDRALVGETFLTFEEELLPLAAALAALGVQVSSHSYPLYTPPLRRPATVVGNRRDGGDAADLQAQRVQGAHRGLATGSRPLDAHLEVLDPAFLRGAPGLLGGNLGSERRRLARALEPGGPRGRPSEG